MRVLHINSMIHGSTGTIMKELAGAVDEGYIAYSPFDGKEQQDNQILIGNKVDAFIHHVLSRLTGKGGLYSTRQTEIFLKKIDDLKPDIIHIHNLHNSFINIEKLFHYLSNSRIPVVWTLHDCWSFTGQCAYYDMAQCKKWKTHCYDCPQISRYPKSWVDKTSYMYSVKKNLFTNYGNMQLVVPSKWLYKQVGESYLKNKPIKIIHNAVDRTIFQPSNNQFRRVNDLDDFYLILAISNRWDARKGISFIIDLSYKIDHNKERLVVVGNLNKQHRNKLHPDTIILPVVKNKQELADLYSSADVFINPTLEENFCLVNMEALACGTPVVCFDTGGCCEIIDSSCGKLVTNKTTQGLLNSIRCLHPKKEYKNSCIKKAQEFDVSTMIQSYKSLYEEILLNRGIQ